MPLEGEARQEVATLVGHDGGVHYVGFSPTGQYLASTGADATVRIWDFKHALAESANPPLQILPGHKQKLCNVAFSANGQLLASRPGNPHASGAHRGRASRGVQPGGVTPGRGWDGARYQDLGRPILDTVP
jgi:hypothetical protein